MFFFVASQKVALLVPALSLYVQNVVHIIEYDAEIVYHVTLTNVHSVFLSRTYFNVVALLGYRNVGKYVG